MSASLCGQQWFLSFADHFGQKNSHRFLLAQPSCFEFPRVTFVPFLSQKAIDYVKMDVEYNEWEVFETLMKGNVLHRVKQFGFEIHSEELFGVSMDTNGQICKEGSRMFKRACTCEHFLHGFVVHPCLHCVVYVGEYVFVVSMWNFEGQGFLFMSAHSLCASCIVRRAIHSFQGRHAQAAHFKKYYKYLKELQKLGFRKWYLHQNPFGIFVSKHTNIERHCCYELVYLNINFLNR